MISNQMISNAKNGDSSAIEQIVSECQKEVYAITKRMLNSSEQDIQDVTQEILIKLFKNIHTIQNPETFHAWLRTIIMNECKMFWRKTERHKIDSFDIDEAESLFSTEQGDYIDILPLEKIDKQDNDRIIYEIICRLPEKYKQVIMLRFYSDMSYIEIADTLDININTVKSRLNAAKEKVEKEIALFEQKHGINLHTLDIFGNLPEIMSNASQTVQIPSGISTSLSAGINSYVSAADAANSAAGVVNALTSTANTASSVSNIVSSGVANTVGTQISNAAATKISIATSAVTVAACIGIILSPLPGADTIPQNEFSIPSTSIIFESSESESSIPESSILESSIPESSIPESSILESSIPESSIPENSNLPIIIHDVSTVFVPVQDESSSVKDYTTYANVTTEDGKYKFRVFYNSDEAVLMEYNGDEENVILPSYVEYNQKTIPVTMMNRDLFSSYTQEYMESMGYIEFDANTEEVEILSKIKSIQFPEHITEIPERFCYGLNGLESISGGYDVTRIGSYAFSGVNFKTLNLDEIFPNLLEIESYAFSNCKLLTKIVMPKNYIYTDDTVFYYSPLHDITITYDYELSKGYPNASVSDYHLKLLGDKISSLNVINTFPNDSVGDAAPRDFHNLYIELENPNAEISVNFGNLFSGNTIKYLYLPNGMTKIHKNEFDNPTSNRCKIENLYIPATVTEIEDGAFSVYSVENIVVSKNNPNFFMKDDILYSAKSNTPVYDTAGRTSDENNKDKHIMIFYQDDPIAPYTGYTHDLYGKWVKMDNVVIEGHLHSYAHQYALDNGFKFIPISEDDEEIFDYDEEIFDDEDIAELDEEEEISENQELSEVSEE